jgi:hypothetical protein
MRWQTIRAQPSPTRSQGSRSERLKMLVKLVAELTLDKAIWQDVATKKWAVAYCWTCGHTITRRKLTSADLKSNRQQRHRNAQRIVPGRMPKPAFVEIFGRGRATIEAWRKDYNEIWPHTSLNE